MVIQLGYLRLTFASGNQPWRSIFILILIVTLFVFPILLIPIVQEFTHAFFGVEISQGLALFFNWLLLSYMSHHDIFAAEILG